MTKKCVYCGREFTTKRYRKVYCSSKCRAQNFLDTHLVVRLQDWAEYQKLKESSPHVCSANEQAAPAQVPDSQ
jgi:hypothetical protein